jgi:hypothetical protein
MRLGNRGGIAVMVVALILCVVQAVLWARSTSRAGSQSAEQNIEITNPPDETPGFAGMTLLVLAGVLLSIPRDSDY